MSNSLRRGLTLLELLIAIALSTLLLAALWQMLGSFALVYEKGQVSTERAQLARSLKQQLRSDLRHCFVPRRDPRSSDDRTREVSSSIDLLNIENSESALFDWPPSIAWDTSSISFVGEPNAMMIDVFQLPADSGGDEMESNNVNGDDFAAARPFDIDLDQDPNTTAQGQRSVYRRVVYLFHDAAATGTESISPSRGLLRRSWELGTEPIDPQYEEFDPLLWFPPIEYPEGSQLDELSAMPEAVTSSQVDSIEPSLEIPGSTSLNTWVNDTIQSDHVPEVSKLRFRYYDGISWRSRWRSSRTGDMPIAVELVFDLDETTNSRNPLREDDLAVDTSLDAAIDRDESVAETEVTYETIDYLSGDYLSGEVPSDASSDEFWKPQHRLIIYLRPDRSVSTSSIESDVDELVNGVDRE